MADKFKEGYFTGSIIDQDMVKSSKGNAMIVLTIQPIFWESFSGVDKEPVSSQWTRAIYLPITVNNVKIVAEQLAALGYRGDPSQIKDKEGEGRLINKEGRFSMQHEEFKGKQKEAWKIVTARKQTDRKPLDELTQTEGLEVDAQFAAAFREAQAEAGPVQEVVTTTTTTATDDAF